jgi:hypothetical protein
MVIFKAVISRKEDNAQFLVDIVEYDDRLWIVPAWLEGTIGGTIVPARIICVDGMLMEKAPANSGADYFLSNPLPTALLEGRGVEQGYVVVEKPDIVRKVGEGL